MCKVNGSSTVVCTISQKCRNGLRCLLHPFQNVHRNHIFIGTLSRAIFNSFSGSRSALEVILGVLREFQTHKYYCFRCLHCSFLAVSLASSGVPAHLQLIHGQCLSKLVKSNIIIHGGVLKQQVNTL